MRDLIIALVLFCLLITGAVLNSAFIRTGVDTLSNEVTAIPSLDSPNCKSEIDELRASWQKFKSTARFTICYSELNRMECLIEEMECHRRVGNVNDFEHARIMILNLLREMSRLEQISVSGIF